MATHKKIAIICASTRNPRVCPTLCTFILEDLQACIPADNKSLALEILDLADHPLPFFNEPIIPGQLDRQSPTAGYTFPATRAWSTKIAEYSGYIFVTPQYNWGVPADLKNHIDYLFWEWRDKVAMVVSYGGHGGNRANDALVLVLKGGLNVRTVEANPMVKLGASHESAMTEGKLVEGDVERVRGELREGVMKGWGKMLELLGEGVGKK